jgi:hypothetical protein
MIPGYNASPLMPVPASPRSPALSTVFIVWCFIVGTLLLYAPWMPIWVRWTAPFTTPWLRDLLMHPTLRGAVSGFGLLHLLWGTHDLDLLISRFLRARQR